MFIVGSIVYHDSIVFKDGRTDTKQNRPCVVIYNDTRKKKLYTMPITSNERCFNKKPYLYTFITNTIYNYKKLSFVKVNDILKNSYSTSHDTGIILDDKDMIRILEKAYNLRENEQYHDKIYKSLNKLKENKQQPKMYSKKIRPTNY